MHPRDRLLQLGALWPWRGLCLLAYWLVWTSKPSAQEPFRFTDVRVLTNKEVRLQLTTPTGLLYRIEASTHLLAWDPLVTLRRSATSLQYTDAAAPFLSQRFYRALQLSETNALTGDHLVTTNGDVVIRPVNHASFVMSWNGKTIYNDPVGGASAYAAFPRADLILVSHTHGDHFDVSTLQAVRKTNGVIIAPAAVYSHSSMTPTLRSNTIVLAYGASTNVMDVTVQAVPGYNGNHAFGINNAFVLTIGGKRIFMSGDTGDVPEIRALTDIDVAFLCMNTPFTMTANEATNSVRAFRPKVVYPYHYRNQSGTTTNAAYFKQILGTDLGIEVRLRTWY
jgi:L-ascorbate metabolism protein UlaG (beta-lactamase superfamily)